MRRIRRQQYKHRRKYLAYYRERIERERETRRNETCQDIGSCPAYVLEESKTLAEIAKRTGLPKSTLNPWLKGQKSLTTVSFDTICEAYDIYPIRADGVPSENVWTVDQLGGNFSDCERATYIKTVQKLNESLRRTHETLSAMQAAFDGIAKVIGGGK